MKLRVSSARQALSSRSNREFDGDCRLADTATGSACLWSRLRALAGIGEILKSYILYIFDDRYQTPNLEVVSADDDEGIRLKARDRLCGSPHHLSVEIWEDDRRVGTVGRKPQTSSPA